MNTENPLAWGSVIKEAWSSPLSEQTEEKFKAYAEKFAQLVERQAEAALREGSNTFYAYYGPYFKQMDYQPFLVERIQRLLETRGFQVNTRWSHWNAWYDTAHISMRISRGEASPSTLDLKAEEAAKHLLHRFDDNLAIEKAGSQGWHQISLEAHQYGWCFELPSAGMKWPSGMQSSFCKDVRYWRRTDSWNYKYGTRFCLDRSELGERVVTRLRELLADRYGQESQTIFRVESDRNTLWAPDSTAVSISIVEAPNGLYKANWEGWEGLENVEARSYCAACCC